MVTILVSRDGVTRLAAEIDPAWLLPTTPEVVWVDIEAPTDSDRLLLSDVFKFHELAIEDALAELHHPKVEAYDNFLYLILHAISSRKDEGFETTDLDFFLGACYLVTVHHLPLRVIEAERGVCLKHNDILADGPAGLLHRLVDRLVDQYGPEGDGLEDRLDALEQSVFSEAKRSPLRQILRLKSDIASLRRVAMPQRDAVGRLARREFPQINEKLAYRFRDVYDHLVRVTDEAVFLQDRVSGLLEAHLSTQSNRLNQVMKVLTVISTIFMPMTVITGAYGMNMPLPHFPGGETAQFWWIAGILAASTAFMLWMFRRLEWL